MTSTVRVTELNNGRFTVHTPFSDDFRSGAKELNGKPVYANGRFSHWEFDRRDIERVRELCREIFGTDGSPEAEADTVTFRWNITGLGHVKGDNELTMSGRRLVWRPGRDEPVCYADGVVLVSGGFPGGGGSMRYPCLLPEDGTVIEVRDFPRAAVAHVEGVTIIESTGDPDALRAERARLLARLAEIEESLGSMGVPLD